MMISKAKISKYSLLRQKKYREREGLFLVQGEKGIKDTLGKFNAEAFIIKKGEPFPEYLPEKTEIYEATESEIKKISTLDSLPDILAVYRIPSYKIDLHVTGDEFVLVLDGIQDPGNMGTIIRTAHWFGIKRIFCSKESADIYNPKVVQATMGSISEININYVDLRELYDFNPEIPVYGLLLEGENIFLQSGLPRGFIVMGSEGHGPSEITKQRITKSLTIPPVNKYNHPDSLNVAIAAAITLSQLIK